MTTNSLILHAPWSDVALSGSFQLTRPLEGHGWQQHNLSVLTFPASAISPFADPRLHFPCPFHRLQHCFFGCTEEVLGITLYQGRMGGRRVAYVISLSLLFILMVEPSHSEISQLPMPVLFPILQKLALHRSVRERRVPDSALANVCTLLCLTCAPALKSHAKWSNACLSAILRNALRLMTRITTEHAPLDSLNFVWSLNDSLGAY